MVLPQRDLRIYGKPTHLIFQNLVAVVRAPHILEALIWNTWESGREVYVGAGL